MEDQENIGTETDDVEAHSLLLDNKTKDPDGKTKDPDGKTKDPDGKTKDPDGRL